MHSEESAPTLRLQFEDGTDKVGLNFDPEADGGWHHYQFALADFSYFDGSTSLIPVPSLSSRSWVKEMGLQVGPSTLIMSGQVILTLT